MAAAVDMQAARPATTAAAAPRRQPAELPDGFWYSVKCRTLGPPLVTEQLDVWHKVEATVARRSRAWRPAAGSGCAAWSASAPTAAPP